MSPTIAQPRSTSPRSTSDSAATFEGEISALRAQLAASQRQQEQTAADLQRYIVESKSNFSRISTDISSLHQERSGADEEICESLKEIFEWIAGSGAGPPGTNGQSQPPIP